MSESYAPIVWNKFKKRYDVFLYTFILVYLLLFFIVSHFLFPQLIITTIVIRAFGTLAILLLHVILIIGPLCRINSQFLPLLYNRRHLGVTMFLIASVHAVLSLNWFHGGGNTEPIISLFISNTHYNSLLFFPFQTLGFLAYIIFMVMAVTSHDFWLNFLSPKVWKAIHMFVYAAYALIIMHVVLGIIQLENSPVLFILLMIGLIAVSTLHIISGYKEWKFDNRKQQLIEGSWLYVCEVNEIEDVFAKMVTIKEERVAIFKYGNKLSAVHNVCKHQNGPLGEGKIVDGCITCPWHGYQYEPQSGCAPAPFNEKVATYSLKLIAEKIYVDIEPKPEGTYIEPTIIPDKYLDSFKKGNPFFIGWAGKSMSTLVSKSALSMAFIALLLAMLFIYNQKHIAQSCFDYENLKTFSGEIVLKPFPALRTFSGNDINGNPIVKTYPLVNAGKFGADDLLKNYLTKTSQTTAMAMVKGAVIHRDNVMAIELSNQDKSIEILKSIDFLPTSQLLKMADTTLQGEIIDPKCYLGAMNPGEGKPHRSCAIRCISGGIMPMITYKNKNRKPMYAILLGTKGEAINQEVLNYVAEPVTISGALYEYDNWLVFYINPQTSITRLYQ